MPTRNGQRRTPEETELLPELPGLSAFGECISHTLKLLMIDFLDASLSGDLAARIRLEFREMPGMCVTAAQAARLWQITPECAESLLREFVQAGFLIRVAREHYRLPSSDALVMRVDTQNRCSGSGQEFRPVVGMIRDRPAR